MKKYTWNEIIEKRMGKGELFENLNVTFDYTLPQEWLNIKL